MTAKAFNSFTKSYDIKNRHLKEVDEILKHDDFATKVLYDLRQLRIKHQTEWDLWCEEMEKRG